MKVRGRFYITQEDGWTVVDDTCGACISFETKREALSFATFIRAYVRKHGDVSLYSAPHSLDQPLTADQVYLNTHDGTWPG